MKEKYTYIQKVHRNDSIYYRTWKLIVIYGNDNLALTQPHRKSLQLAYWFYPVIFAIFWIFSSTLLMSSLICICVLQQLNVNFNKAIHFH